MIKSFGNKETEKIYNGQQIKKLPLEIQRIELRKLIILDQSQDIRDLRIPPSNKLEKLKGKLKAFHSIRINDQWRIIFQWKSGDAFDVKIEDYH